MDTRDPEFSSHLRRQLASAGEDARICACCEAAITTDRDEDGEPVCEDCADDADKSRAREAADKYLAAHPLVHSDVTVRRTPSGWVAFDWVSRARLYP